MQLEIDITDAQAFALAQLCKCLGYSDAMSLSVDEVEARQMLTAADMLRGALARAGYPVR